MSSVDMKKAWAVRDGVVRERVAGGELDDLADLELTEEEGNLLIQAAQQEPEVEGFGLPGLMDSNSISASFLGQLCDGRDPRERKSFDLRTPGVWAPADQDVDWTIVQ